MSENKSEQQSETTRTDAPYPPEDNTDADQLLTARERSRQIERELATANQSVEQYKAYGIVLDQCIEALGENPLCLREAILKLKSDLAAAKLERKDNYVDGVTNIIIS